LTVLETAASVPEQPATGLVHRELWELVRDELRRLIINGELAPGERLVETALSERFSVSRGPVRTALKELERVGLVVVLPRRGSHVATFDGQDIDELYDVTLAFERVAAARAAARVTPADVKRLQQMLHRLSAAETAGDRDAAVAADLELHRQIMELSGNRRLVQLWGQLAEEMRLAIAISQRSLPDVTWAERNVRIIDALVAGDSERAEAEIVSYFARAQREMREQFDAAPVGNGSGE
jgi:DNA-binding GntR family transcriptional regulator